MFLDKGIYGKWDTFPVHVLVLSRLDFLNVTFFMEPDYLRVNSLLGLYVEQIT
jgi:hypothetical protein